MALSQSEIGARLLVLYENRVLLASHRGQTWYFLPGGRVRPGETVEDALRRETDGLTGLEVGALDFVGCTEQTHTEDGAVLQELIVVFAAPLPWAAQIISNDPGVHLASIAVEDLAGLELRPAVLKELIERWVAGRRPLWRSTLPTA
ncbi:MULTISPECIES: NUDIX domain-containing protein [Pseudofrankia]|uniref:NUDIX domain-containing protein n=1 Tax=Pseudofrankia TaxID=2994363 RepID=UPI000234C58E|nr:MULTISPECIES: NUDIX domain-containing protein [Pseudofrankia]OHV34395.1 NUDIX hydrolase [Pseudofrankia sp. EUN1h]